MSHWYVVRSFAYACRRGAALLAAALLLAAVPAAAGAAGPETADQTLPVSTNAAGAWADGEGVAEFTTPSVSADGRYVAFQSAATNLGEAGPAGVEEGFVKDLQTGAVSLVSRVDGEDGEAAGAPGISGLRLSANGRFVVFTSAATNLGTPLPGEEAGETHVYRRDLESGETVLVDRLSGPGGAILSRGAVAAGISADGRYVAFTAHVENLEDPSGDHTETASAVGYLRDLETGATVAVTRASGSTGVVGNETTEGLSLSPDGRSVAFTSRATNLVPGAESGENQVYRRDLETATTTLVSVNALGDPGDRSSGLATASGPGGCLVTFSSIAFNLLEPSPLEVSGEQVYVADACESSPTMTLVSQSATAPIAPFAYSVAGASEDGAKALFAAEFVGSPCCHLYLRDLEAGQTTLLDRASGSSGAIANGELEEFALAANGCRAVFASRATNLSADPPGNGSEEPTELYARQLKPCVPPADESGGRADPESEAPPGDAGAGGATGGDPSIGATAASAPPRARLGVERLDAHRLLLRLSAAGRVSIRVRRLVPAPPRAWKLVRTIESGTDTAGTFAVPLGSLAPGRYRFGLHLHGAPHGTVCWLRIE